MAQLAIKGHKTRGNEVIALLEMLGGKNGSLILYDGRDTDSFYRITDDSCIVSSRFCPNKKGVKYQTYTLEVFEKEFPYKVGDEVRLAVPDKVRITNMYWDPCSDQVICEALSVNGGREYDCLNVKQLLPCKEQSSPDKAKAPSLEGQDYSEGRCGYMIPEGFEFDKVENGEIILKPKKKELPKTYEECCEVIGISRHDVEIDLSQPYQQNMFNLFKLLICRDAYWKLADDWKPCWNGYNGDSGLKYCIFQHGASLMRGDTISRGCILMFPTAEMRDTFYENFKDLILKCKEFL